ncbi:hypothetical protein BGZ83_000988, partial [Gryganskiella cystojenkinii]
APWQVLSSTRPKSGGWMVASPDNKTLYTLERNGADNSVTLTNYNIGMNVWDSRVVPIPSSNNDRQGMTAIMDPNTWTIYMSVNGATKLEAYDLNTSTLQLLPSYNDLTSRYFGGGVYNKLRNSLMYFGGWNFQNVTPHFNPLATYVREYSLTTQQWANVYTANAPPIRSDFCMAVNEDGSKVVVYGGRLTDNKVFTGTIFIFDVTASNWTKGPAGDLNSYMTCIIVGDQFLAWGGSPGKTTWDTPPRIFDMTLLNWTTTYKAPAYYLNTPESSSAVPSPSNDLGLILGGTFGGLLVLATAGVIFVCLKHRENRIKYGIHSVLRNPQKGMVGAQDSVLRSPQQGMVGALDSEPHIGILPASATPSAAQAIANTRVESFTAKPKDAQTASAAMFAAAPTTPSSPSTAYLSKSSYSATAAVAIPPVPKSTVTSSALSPQVLSNYQQFVAFRSSTELSHQQSHVYRAQYYPSTTGTATPDGSSTAAGSPANSDSLVYTTAPMDPNTVPSNVYNNNAYSVPVMQNPALISTRFSGTSAPVNMAAFALPPHPSNLSDVIYAASPTTSQVSPALPSSARQQTPVTAHRDFSAVGVPDIVTEDLYVNYVLV